MLCIFTLGALAVSQEAARPSDQETLRGLADRLGFTVGALIGARFWYQDREYRPLLAREFNAAISIVFMKLTEPEKGQFRFEEMDREMQFARQHDMKLFGAALIYRPNTLPPWLVSIVRQSRFRPPKDEMDRIMKDFIQTIVRHGGNTYSAWEVVNEPLSSPNNPWGMTFGQEDYISRAFRYAHEANPHAQLVLNQTFGTDGVDRELTDRFFDLVGKLKTAGVPIDVAGIEMHLEAQKLMPPYLDDFRYFLKRAREAGVEVQITEMDVYQGPPGVFADPMDNQKKIFHDVVSACLDDSNCKAFYTWGLSDTHTWLAMRPSHPLLDAKPLLFDEKYEKKPAYFGVLEALEERAAHAS